jgi:hypothetical protein
MYDTGMSLRDSLQFHGNNNYSFNIIIILLRLVTSSGYVFIAGGVTEDPATNESIYTNHAEIVDLAQPNMPPCPIPDGPKGMLFPHAALIQGQPWVYSALNQSFFKYQDNVWTDQTLSHIESSKVYATSFELSENRYLVIGGRLQPYLYNEDSRFYNFNGTSNITEILDGTGGSVTVQPGNE